MQGFLSEITPERKGLSVRYFDSGDFVYTFAMKSPNVIAMIADWAIAIKTQDCLYQSIV